MTTATIRPYRELLPNGEIRIHMHYGQIAVMMSKAREILALAGVQCIAAGEYVYGANGPVLVDDVQEGEEIIGGVVSNRQEYEADIYEIVFSNGIRIRLSSEHPLWHKQEVTSAPCWASVSDLYDTPLRVGKYQRAFAAKGYVKFEKATLKGIPIAHAKLLGYLTSDGCFTHGQGVKFTNTNRTFIDDVASLSIPLGVKAEAKPKGTGWDLHLTLDKGHRNPIKIYLASLGVTQTSFGDVVRADRESSIEFLRGYFNGDGYLRIERRNQKDSRLDTALIGFCTDGKTKSVEMQFILWKLGIISKIQHEWMSKGTRPFYRVTVTGKFLRILLGLLEDTKYPDQFRAALSQSLPTIDKYKEDDNGYWVGIRGVQKVGRGKVIGWTTLGNNEIVSYCGMKTHNSGKTSVGIDWIDREIRQKGEGDYLVVSATYPLMQFRLLPEFLDVFQTMQHLGKWREADKLFEFNANKTRVFFGTATNPESLESATAKAAIADEAGQSQFRREAREALLRRLSRHQGRILYPTTPYQLGWLKTELFDRAKQPESDIEVISWPSTANPVFPQAEMDRAKMVMPGWKYRMFYEGKFERPAGLIYDAFDEATCKIHRFPIPQNWLRYVGHDFGCVDEETQILTSRGWKYHQEVIDGEVVLTQNPQTGMAEWQPVQAMSRWEGHFDMHLIDQRGHNSLTTIQHRWLVRKRQSDKLAWATTTTLKHNDRVAAAAECANLPTQATYSDSFVEMVAWFWTEGQIDAGGVSIWQNEGAKAEQIRRCLTAEFGEPLTQTRNGRERAPAGWVERPAKVNHSPRSGLPTGKQLCHFSINRNGAERLVAVAPHRTVKPEFITSLTASQLKIFIDTSIKGDGWERYGRGGTKAGQSISQSKAVRLDSFQMACTLVGIRTSLYVDLPSSEVGRDDLKRSLLSLHKRSNVQLGKAKQQCVAYEGVIWCPTTPNATWCARRKGTVFFTGNTANPAAMFYAQDPGTGYFYAYGEYKPGPGRSTREHAMEFKRLTEGVNVLKRAGGSHQEEEIRAAYTANGWFIQEPKIHDVAAGIDRVYALHKLNKLFVFDDLQKYLDEKLSYSYALDDNYEPTDEIENKSSYHLLDAERYILSDFTPELVDGQEQFFTMKVFGGEAKRSHSHLKKAGRRW